MEIDPRLLKLQDKAKTLPATPGCYLMKNKQDEIIYVGKAIDLKSRVQSYFNQSAKNPKTLILVSHIVDFDFMMTGSDAEAFVLENNLIKKHRPKYNIRLKDDKSYPYIVIDHREIFARLQFIRKVKREKKVEVFGPFVKGSQVFDVMRVLNQFFGLRDCSLTEFKKRKEPCLLFQMAQCSAPCVQKISAMDYEKNVQYASDFFRGQAKTTLRLVEDKMLQASDAMEFERAAFYRDQYKILADFHREQHQKNAELSQEKNVDIIAFYIGEEEVDLSLYLMRNGLLLGHKNFHFSTLDLDEQFPQETLAHFLFQYYAETYDALPEQVIVDQFEVSVLELLQAGFASLHHHSHHQNSSHQKIEIKKPQGQFASLLELTKEHAFQSQKVRMLHDDSVFIGLNKLKDLLGLKTRPRVIECYDIAIFQGKSPTAAQIVFHDGKADKKNYRHYNLQERPEGNNDFAMMQELIERRLDNGHLPDVFVVDGGFGQMSKFIAALKEAKLNIPVVGIAKSKVKKSGKSFTDEHIKKSEERLLIPGRANPYFLSQNRSLFKIIVQMRDEAHRFSRRLHHKKEHQRLFKKN